MTAVQFFTQLTEKYADIKPGKMFGCDCIKTPNGKAAAMLWHDNIIVKLNEIDLAASLTIKGAKIFEPMEGRPMNGWVQIPFSQKKEWELWLQKSIELVKTIPAREPKKRKNK